ncbi:MAG TPA: IS1182 family transposase, partial [Dehalococcoidia bacterium]|nr:IS1182 family transposase [Dehalococcoidia bacterium]
MTLRPEPVTPVPEETTRVARAAFPKGNLYMRIRDELGAIYQDTAFAPLFSTLGQPAESPWQLALVTLIQFAENLSDRQAADAVRGRIDWKYALSLELTDPGFDSTVLCEFRARLLAGNAEQLLLDALLDLCRGRGWLTARGRQRTDSTHVLAAIQALNRLQCVHETIRHALNTLALVAPEWLRTHSQPEWVESYGPKADDYRLPPGKEQRLARAQAIGQDGHTLLAAVYATDAPGWLREVPAVETLRRVWVQQYYLEGEHLHWRTEVQGIPPSRQVISSPYDLEARLGRKGTTQWIGYKVHLTESCEEDQPHLITQVTTTPAPLADGTVTPSIHKVLGDKGLLPQRHLVDTGYLDAALLARAWREYRVDLFGPTRPDYKWQARAGKGFAAASFQIDWERQQAICPEGRTSLSWTPAMDRLKNEVIKIKFSMRDCGPCPSRAACTRAPRRTVTVRRQEHHLALQAARAREGSAGYAAEYARRAGIEGT